MRDFEASRLCGLDHHRDYLLNVFKERDRTQRGSLLVLLILAEVLQIKGLLIVVLFEEAFDESYYFVDKAACDFTF